MSNRPFEDEGVFRTDEQAGTNTQQFQRTEREFDPANRPVAGNDPRETKFAPASLTTNLAGPNNDLVFTAVTPGTGGNSITVTYTDPGGVTAALSVGVVGNAITVTLGRAASTINTTASALAAAIQGSAPASALVTVANAPGNDGTGLVTAMATTNLSGGMSTGEPALTRHEQSQLRTDEQTDVGGIGADIKRSDPADT